MRTVTLSLLLLILGPVTWASAGEQENRARDDEKTVPTLDDQERLAVLIEVRWSGCGRMSSL
jgi:hypothetical protein